MLAGHRFFKKMIGSRSEWPNDKNKNFVQLLMFENPKLSANHVALMVVKDDIDYFISFVPDDMEAFEKQNSLEYRNGIACYFVPNIKDEYKIQGFRMCCPDIWEKVPEKLRQPTHKRHSAREILEIVNQLPKELIKELQRKGQPQRICTLNSLDVDKMVEMIDALKNNENVEWAAYSGALWRKKNIFNCASILLHVLNEGGLGNLIVSTSEVLSIVGALIGLVWAASTCPTFGTLILGLAIGFISGHVLGSAYDGYRQMQSFLNVINAEHADKLSVVLSLRLINTLLSSLVSLYSPGSTISSIITLPNELFKLVEQAKEEENSLYYSPPHLTYST